MVDSETVKNLENLHRLKTEGIITEAEFDKAKAELLSGAKPRTAKHVAARITPVWNGTLPAADDYVAWMILPLKRYADFTGRSSRKEYWMFQLLIGLVTAATLILAAMGRPAYSYQHSGFSDAVIGLWVLAMLGALVPLLAVQVRRFHDQDKSGWCVLINLFPYIGPLIALGLMMIEGTQGDNQFGPDPVKRDT